MVHHSHIRKKELKKFRHDFYIHSYSSTEPKIEMEMGLAVFLEK